VGGCVQLMGLGLGVDVGYMECKACAALTLPCLPQPPNPPTPQDNRVYLSRISSTLQLDTGAMLREARAAVDEVRRELSAARGGGGPGGAPPMPLGPRLAALEGKLGVVETALLGAGESMGSGRRGCRIDRVSRGCSAS